MARLETYQFDEELDGSEYLIGTDKNNSNVTRSYRLDKIARFISSGDVSTDGADDVIDGFLNDDGTYTWLKYATNSAPLPEEMFDTPTLETTWFGIGINKSVESESLDYTDYEWREVSGDPSLNFYYNKFGDKVYFWIKYAESLIPPMGIVDTAVGMKYVGLAFDKAIAEPETSAHTEEWWSSNLEWHQALIGFPNPGTSTYNWFTFASNSSGSDISVFIDGKKYIGIAYEKTSPIEDANPSLYKWTLFDAPHPEIDADDILTGLFTHIKFTSSPFGTLQDNPQGSNYIGFKYNQETATPESDVYTDYTWRDISYKGFGVSQPSSFTWLKFSEFEDGLDGATASMQDTADGMSYIGIAINQLLAESLDPNSDDPSFYIWAPIVGDISYVGADGITYYIWVKYATNSTGTANFQDDPLTPVIATYIGFSYSNLIAESLDPKSALAESYEWSLIGSDIENTEWLYYWIKFSTSDIDRSLCPSISAVENFSDSSLGATWMGIAYDKKTSVESYSPCAYTWNPLTGDQGYIGPDGKTYYTWVKYIATLEDGVPMYTVRAKDSQWMGISSGHLDKDSENTDTEVGGSENWKTYTWISLDSEDGKNGDPGADGLDGIDGKDGQIGVGLDGKDGKDGVSINQNNIVTVKIIPSSYFDDKEVTEESISNWVNANGLSVLDIENIIFSIGETDGGGYVAPRLDPSIKLPLTLLSKTADTASFSWVNNDTALIRYELFYNALFDDLGDENVTSKTLTGLSPIAYSCYVIGYDTYGTSKKSDTITFSLYVAFTPNINITQVTATGAFLDYDIDDAFVANKFEIYRSMNGNAFSLIYTESGIPEEDWIFGDSRGSYYRDESLIPDTDYCYYTIAYQDDLESSPSEIKCITTKSIAPTLSEPTITFLDRKENSIKFSISVPNSDIGIVTALRIEYRTMNNTVWDPNWNEIPSIAYTNITTLNNLFENTNYQIRVRSTDGTIISPYSNVLERFTLTSEKAKISLRLINELSEQDIDNEYVNPITIWDGKPNTVVNVNITVSMDYLGNKVIGSLDFKDSSIYLGSNESKIIPFTLDENGGFYDLFKINANIGSFYGVINATVTATIVSSINGIDSTAYTDSNSYSIEIINF